MGNREVGEIGITSLRTVPENCLFLPATITENEHTELYNIGIEEISLGNQLFALNPNQTITIRNPQFPVGRIANDADFGVLGRTGGVRTVTLTAAQMPAHTHTQNAHSHGQNWHNHGQDAHTHGQNWHNHAQAAHSHAVYGHTQGGVSARNAASMSSRLNATFTTSTTTATNQYTQATNQYTQATNHGVTVANHANTATNNNTGGGGAHTNLPPYTVVNYWICYREVG